MFCWDFGSPNNNGLLGKNSSCKRSCPTWGVFLVPSVLSAPVVVVEGTPTGAVPVAAAHNGLAQLAEGQSLACPCTPVGMGQSSEVACTGTLPSHILGYRLPFPVVRNRGSGKGPVGSMVRLFQIHDLFRLFLCHGLCP